jgi:molybdate transport system substrate-binding protein
MTQGRIKVPNVSATLLAISGAFAATLASAEPVEIFAAGSLRGVVTELAQDMAADYNIEVKPSFGGSGSLRERIEKGEKPDLLLSADLGSPRKLEAQGRTVVPTAAFARNRMCIVSRRSAGVTASNLIDRMLKRDVRLKTSTPIADPAGDYAWAIFDRVNVIRPGAGTKLQEKAQASMSVTATPLTPTGSAAAALFAAKQIDMSITYCSASSGLTRELPELSSLEVPPSLDPHPVYAVAVLSVKPEVMRVVLFLFSEKGQALIAHQGLLPLMDSPATTPK